MRFQYLRLIGPCPLFMPMAFVVRLVGRRMLKGQKTYGLIADRLSTQTTKSVNGKSFTIVNVAVSGGLGATIVHPLNLENGPIVNLEGGLLSIRWTIGRASPGPLGNGEQE